MQEVGFVTAQVENAGGQVSIIFSTLLFNYVMKCNSKQCDILSQCFYISKKILNITNSIPIPWIYHKYTNTV